MLSILDDWYYLNIASAPKSSTIEDDILIIQNSLKSNENCNNTVVQEEILPTPSDKVQTIKLKKEKVEKPDTKKLETQKSKINKKETANVPVFRKRKGKRRRRWTIYGKRNKDKEKNKAKLQDTNIKNKNVLKKSSLIDNGTKVVNLKNENCTVNSLVSNESKDQMEDIGIIEGNICKLLFNIVVIIFR